jgi:hypothetical protein
MLRNLLDRIVGPIFAWRVVAAVVFASLLTGSADGQTNPTTRLASTPIVALALTHALKGDGTGCSAAELRTIVQKADLSILGTIGESRVVLAAVSGLCICGNVNCPYVVLQLDGARSTVLLDTYAYAVGVVGKERPLPNLREVAHDSALVSVTTTDAYRNGKYVGIDTQRIRGDTGESKPDSVPVRFALGSSSAVLIGRVSEGWYDQYTFAAAAGQRITIGGPAALTYSLSVKSSDKPIDLLPDLAVTLPKGGRYRLLVDGAGETEQAYRATITIH